jgi:hypothetical protein
MSCATCIYMYILLANSDFFLFFGKIIRCAPMSCAGSANAECRRATGKRIKCEPLRCCHPCWFSAEFFPCSIRELIDCRACDAGWTCISMTICSTGTCRRQRRPSWQRGRLLLIQSVIIFSAPLVLLAPFRICARLRFDRGKEFSY